MLTPEDRKALDAIRRETPIGRLHDEIARTSTCYWCEQVIRRSDDGAWEDESGACGCLDGEHVPCDGRSFRDVHGHWPWESQTR